MGGENTSLRSYVVAYLALLCLTGLTFGLSFAHLGAAEWVAALGIAALKALIVALFFMHLTEMSAAHRLAGFVAVTLLATLILFAMADVWTRPQEVGPEVLPFSASADP